jgi:gamma-glutamyltranspeptidase / glutathione hydrolase
MPVGEDRVLAPFASRYAPHAMACAVDHLAAGAAIDVLRRGGTAADAAVAASAVLAVTSQHVCGMGGDLFALVGSRGDAPTALNASGRAGSGADAARLRAEGHRRMPATGDVRAVPVPGCVDGWLALHDRYGRLPLMEVLAAALDYAQAGFPASPTLVLSAREVHHLPGAGDFAAAATTGALVRRPALARTLETLATHGRDAFYGGEFGKGLLELGAGEYSPDDLARCQADWVRPIAVEVWGHRLWSLPPNSQGYLLLAAAAVAADLPLPTEVDDPLWAHLTIEAIRAVSADRERVLSDRADPAALLAPDRLARQAAAIGPGRAAVLGDGYRAGGTIYLCVVDSAGDAISR